jgi:GT2 family glycosyltransferase/SAM-dependent methyltransferase
MRYSCTGPPTLARIEPMAGERSSTVSVVTVNYDGRRYLEALLPSLAASDFPADRFEVLVVDNGSTDDSVAWIRREFPSVRIVETDRNRGFAGGCNAGIQASDATYVALINNDAVVDRGWLRTLVEAAETDARIGMVGSKVVFLTRFLDLRLTGTTFVPTEFGIPDGRRLSVRLLDARIEGCRYDKVLYGSGCYGEERIGDRRFRWLAEAASIAVPIDDPAAPATLLLTLGGAPWIPRQDVVVSIGAEPIAGLAVGPGEETFRVKVPASLAAGARHVINNAGSYLAADGRFGDRGIFAFDAGQYDRAQDAEALCGASVLLRRAMLERIGTFDERFFMYFEDMDLCWRARRAGWRLVYAPASVAHHVHAGSSVEWSPQFTYLVRRNHVMWLVKHGRPRPAIRAVAAAARRASHALRDGSSAVDVRVARDLALRLPGLVVGRALAGARTATPVVPLGCNICGDWGPFGNTDHTEFGACPGCASVTRDRMLFAAFLGREPGRPARLTDCVPSARRVVECSPRLGVAYRDEMRRRFDYLAIDFDEHLHTGDRQEDLQALTLPSDSVDVFLCAHVLEHIERDMDALRDMLRVLRPGGRLFLQVPIKRARTVIPPEPTYHADHTLVFREFGLIDLAETIRAAGYQIRIAVLPRLLDAMADPEASWVVGLRQDDCTFADKFGPRAETLSRLRRWLEPVASPTAVAAAGIGAISYQEVFICTKPASLAGRLRRPCSDQPDSPRPSWQAAAIGLQSDRSRARTG